MNDAEHYGIAGATAQAISSSAETAIRRGLLQPGDALPPVRALAASLGVSPNTVASAYRALGDRGVVVGEGRRGTRVASRPPVRRSVIAPVPAGLVDLASGNPDPALLPRLPTVRRPVGQSPRLYGGEPVDLPELVDLARSRFTEIEVPVEEVIVLGGALDAIERVLGACLRPGDRVAVEDPGFPPLVDLLRAMSLTPIPVALDERGPSPSALEDALTRGPHAVVITPRAQNPTGAALEPERARELASVLRRHPGVVVVEDDHAGPVAGAPAVSIFSGSPPTDRWAVVASVSKWLGPDLRVAVMAADHDTAGRVAGRRALGPGWVSTILQAMVADLWADDRAMARVAGAATEYASRRRALLEALGAHGLAASGRTGLNVWVPVPEEAAVLAAARDAGYALAPGERFRLLTGPAVRISIGALRRRDVEPVAAAVASAVRPGRRSVHAAPSR